MLAKPECKVQKCLWCFYTRTDCVSPLFRQIVNFVDLVILIFTKN
jgi:hypothetical protein